jgi:hypothetical protein
MAISNAPAAGPPMTGWQPIGPPAQIRYTQPVIASNRSRERSVAGGDEAISLKTLQKP